MKRTNKKKYLVYLALAILAVAIGYSTYVYLKSGISEQGLVFCEAGRCFLVPGDIHAQVDIEVCGKYLDLPLDKGSTEGPHTHKERNLVHFEYRLEADPVTKEVTDRTPLTLKAFFEAMEVKFSNECIADKCNGDLCNGKSGIIKMLINDLENNEFENYIWKDDDKILIKFE